MDNVGTAVGASTQQISEFEKQAKKAYESAKEEAQKYEDQVPDLNEKIKNSQIETQDTIRELNRKGMTEEQEWADEELEAQEKLSEAKQALAQGDYELAESLANESKTLFTGLAQEVQDNEGNIIKSIEQTKEVATSGVQAVGDFSVQMYEQQKENAEASQQTWQKAMDQIQQDLDKITQDREAKVKITLQDIAAAESRINELTKSETKTIYIKTVQTNQTGGPVYGFSQGQYIPRNGKLPGYGGGDKIRSLLEPGEFVLRKEAVQAIGLATLNDLNALHFNLGGAVPDFPIPQIPNLSTNSPGETLTLKFQSDDMEATTIISDTDSKFTMKKFAQMLERKRLTNVG
jgi:hypothetical protein